MRKGGARGDATNPDSRVCVEAQQGLLDGHGPGVMRAASDAACTGSGGGVNCTAEQQEQKSAAHGLWTRLEQLCLW